MLLSPVFLCMILIQPVGEAVQTQAANASQENSVIASSHARDATDGSGNGATTTATTLDVNYRIGPEDLLLINVWKEPDLSVTVPVRADGKISLPLASEIRAAGLTPSELAAALTERLAKFVNQPSVTVIVTQINSRKVYVMGMVNRQGTVRLLSNLTVLQVLSAAGGLAPLASSRKIYVLRTEKGQQHKLPFDYDAVIKGKHPEQNVLLQPGDTIVVP